MGLGFYLYYRKSRFHSDFIAPRCVLARNIMGIESPLHSRILYSQVHARLIKHIERGKHKRSFQQLEQLCFEEGDNLKLLVHVLLSGH